MTMVIAFVSLVVLVATIGAAELPPGLRPAKSVDQHEKAIVPLAVEHQAPPNVRTPPNLSLRSRMIAAQNTAAAASLDEASEDHDVFKSPVVFSKAAKTSKPSGSGSPVKKTVILPASAAEETRSHPRVTVRIGPRPCPTKSIDIAEHDDDGGSGSTAIQQHEALLPGLHLRFRRPDKPVAVVVGPPPPSGNYGVNTLLQTNLVDSRGRVIKGVSSVPIPVSPNETRSGKGQATSSSVNNDEDRIVPVKFGRAGDN